MNKQNLFNILLAAVTLLTGVKGHTVGMASYREWPRLEGHYAIITNVKSERHAQCQDIYLAGGASFKLKDKDNCSGRFFFTEANKGLNLEIKCNAVSNNLISKHQEVRSYIENIKFNFAQYYDVDKTILEQTQTAKVQYKHTELKNYSAVKNSAATNSTGDIYLQEGKCN
jgi:hypothetical protein